MNEWFVQHPWASGLIMLLIGFGLGWLTGAAEKSLKRERGAQD